MSDPNPRTHSPHPMKQPHPPAGGSVPPDLGGCSCGPCRTRAATGAAAPPRPRAPAKSCIAGTSQGAAVPSQDRPHERGTPGAREGLGPTKTVSAAFPQTFGGAGGARAQTWARHGWAPLHDPQSRTERRPCPAPKPQASGPRRRQGPPSLRGGGGGQGPGGGPDRRRLPSNRRRLHSNRRRLPSNRRRLPSPYFSLPSFFSPRR